MPKFSVLVPSYNHERYIERALRSALDQSERDLELIVVDDGSQDRSRERIEAIRDPRLRVVFQANQGAHAALNRALSMVAPGTKYVAILNSDDEFSPDWLRTCGDVLDRERAVGFCSGHLRFEGDDGEKRRWYTRALANFRRVRDVTQALAYRNFIMTTSNVVFRHDVVLRSGGFRPLRYVHDLDFFLRLAECSEFRLVRGRHVLYRIHASNTISEPGQSRRIVYEFAWILVDRIFRERSLEDDLSRLAERVFDTVRVIDRAEIAFAALTLFSLRARLERRATSAEEIERCSESWLAEDNEVFRAVVSGRETSYSAAVDELWLKIGTLRYDLGELERLRDKDISALRDDLTQLRHSRAFQLGHALANARGVYGWLKLPVRLGRVWASTRRASDAAGAPLRASHG